MTGRGQLWPVPAPGWEGWWFDDTGELFDPAGNRYRPDDMRSSWWGRQAWSARAGYPHEIAFLREVLADRIEAATLGVRIEVYRETRHGRQLMHVLTVNGASTHAVHPGP